jgi:hypothetical protein
MSREVWNTDDNALDMSQLRTAWALARKNICIARRKSPFKAHQLDRPLKVGDRVFRQNFQSTKIDLKWLPGYRIVEMQSTRTAVVEHIDSYLKSRVNVKHLRLSDPVSDLIYGSNIDVSPGETKLYFSAGDLPDLDWEPIAPEAALDPELEVRAKEISRKRDNDLTMQREAKRPRLHDDTSSSQSGDDIITIDSTIAKQVPSTLRRSERNRRRSTRLKDCVVGTVLIDTRIYHALT